MYLQKKDFYATNLLAKYLKICDTKILLFKVTEKLKIERSDYL